MGRENVCTGVRQDVVVAGFKLLFQYSYEGIEEDDTKMKPIRIVGAGFGLYLTYRKRG
jgi:hypothetical protein